MSLFLASQSWPFLLAVILLIALAVIEGLSLLCGFSVSGWIDDFLPDPPGDGIGQALDSWLGWLHVGKVPLLIVLTILLTTFAITGFVINGLAHAVLGIYPSAVISAPLAFLSALPVVRVSASAISRLIPRDETSAEPLENLVGKIAVVVNGTARAAYPAQARVKNDHGQTLYVHVEPDADGVQFVAGDSVLLVKQVSGAHFTAIVNPRPDLL